MKKFTNLSGMLRLLFGTLRILTVVLAAFWLLTLTLNSWIQRQFTDEPKLMVSMGQVLLQVDPDAMRLESDSAKSGSLQFGSLRGNLLVDLSSKDPELVSALRWTVLPALAVFIVFAWVLFSSLRQVCANIEKGEIFSERNLRLVRGIGMALIAYSLAGGAVRLWGAHVMGDYFGQHVMLVGIAGTAHFGISPELFSAPGGLVTGLLVLVVSEAFRQGLALKTENELTV